LKLMDKQMLYLQEFHIMLNMYFMNYLKIQWELL